jgi:16S rRNA (adenine1518-N6/adenine1519-N6)-dimethyltransferase
VDSKKWLKIRSLDNTMSNTRQKINFRPKKSLGQHFLRSEGVLNKITRAGSLDKNDTVLEAGPGLGHLTEKLLEQAGRVISVEKDSRLIPYLSEKFQKEIKNGKLSLISKDILELDPSVSGLDLGAYKIVANLPYYITGKFIRKFLSLENKPKSMTLLLQKEVAKRIVARDRKESMLSISIKVYGKPHYVATVKRELFKPEPKVDSAILLIDEISSQKIPGEETFFQIMRRGFSSKRKKLIGNLKILRNSRFWEEVFRNCHISQNVRAEELSIENWFCLNKKYCESHPRTTLGFKFKHF